MKLIHEVNSVKYIKNYIKRKKVKSLYAKKILFLISQIENYNIESDIDIVRIISDAEDSFIIVAKTLNNKLKVKTLISSSDRIEICYLIIISGLYKTAKFLSQDKDMPEIRKINPYIYTMH